MSKSKLNISDDLLTIIVSKLSASVKGVYAMSDARTALLIKPGAEITWRRGVRITRSDKKTDIDIFITATYGTRIPTLAWELQKKVKERIEFITGSELESVNIHVQGVTMG